MHQSTIYFSAVNYPKLTNIIYWKFGLMVDQPQTMCPNSKLSMIVTKTIPSAVNKTIPSAVTKTIPSAVNKTIFSGL